MDRSLWYRTFTGAALAAALIAMSAVKNAPPNANVRKHMFVLDAELGCPSSRREPNSRRVNRTTTILSFCTS